MARPAALVERLEPIGQNLDVRVGWAILNVEPETGLLKIHSHDGTPCKRRASGLTKRKAFVPDRPRRIHADGKCNIVEGFETRRITMVLRGERRHDNYMMLLVIVRFIAIA
jgi:hypothetical protein